MYSYAEAVAGDRYMSGENSWSPHGLQRIRFVFSGDGERVAGSLSGVRRSVWSSSFAAEALRAGNEGMSLRIRSLRP